jgi:murein DD-endopeptidase MepM/ murein hydrolase activator NlpD
MKTQKRGKKAKPHLSWPCILQGTLKKSRKIRRNIRPLRKTFLFCIKKLPYSQLLLAQFILATFLASDVFGQTLKVDQPRTNNLTNIQTIKAQVFPFEIQKPLENAELSQDFASYHQAIDLAAEYGEDVKPIGPGKVEEVGYDPYGKGEIVVIDHGSNIRSLYAHLGKIEVQKGEEVKDDTVLGKVGLTGHTTGSHLHLEIYEGQEMLDPKSFVPKEEYSIQL